MTTKKVPADDEWDDEVAASRAALADGDFVEFDSDDPNDVIHWLVD